MIPYTSCRETKLQSFQYKIIHRIFNCNHWLHIIGITTSSKCNLCDHPDDTIVHYFVNCPTTHGFWNNFVDWWNAMDFPNLNPLKAEDIILGCPVITFEDNILNFCLIICKWFIYSCKRDEKELFFPCYLQYLKNKLDIEYNIHYKNETIAKFEKTWGQLYNYF